VRIAFWRIDAGTEDISEMTLGVRVAASDGLSYVAIEDSTTGDVIRFVAISTALVSDVPRNAAAA
jgi:hypothetical protein